MVCCTLAVAGVIFGLVVVMVFAYAWLFGALDMPYELSWLLETSNGARKGRWSASAGAFGVGHTLAMTEQEAEALAARLTRIWKPEQLEDTEKTI
jgi:hypothetical protein